MKMMMIQKNNQRKIRRNPIRIPSSISIQIPIQIHLCCLPPYPYPDPAPDPSLPRCQPFNVKTESRSSRTGKTIAQSLRLRCTNIIASYTPPPPPILLLPHYFLNTLLYQSDILQSSRLLPSGPIPDPSSYPVLPPPTPL